METTIVCWGCIGIMEKKMETTNYWRCILFLRAEGLGIQFLRCRPVIFMSVSTMGWLKGADASEDLSEFWDKCWLNHFLEGPKLDK